MTDTAVLGGLGAALFWGAQQALSARATRRTHPLTALLGISVVGLLTALPLAVMDGLPSSTFSEWRFAVIAAVADLCGLSLIFMAFQKGPLALVAPIASAQGGTATLVAVLMGEKLSLGDLMGLVLVTTGMVIVLAYQHRHRNEPAGDETLASALLALGSCVAIGVALYALSQSSAELGTAWTLVVLKGVGIVLLATVLSFRGVLSIPRESFHLIIPAGIADNIGFASFLAGTAAGSIAIPAVLASQFSIVAALIGIVVFGERLARVQALGLAVVIIGVALLATQR